MKITIIKAVTSKVNVEDLKVVKTNSRNVDSVNLVIYYDNVEIGNGHFNKKTNWAHISLDEENQDLEDYLVSGIEKKRIKII